MSTILITGATGFLGRHLVRQLRHTQPDSRLRVLARSSTPWDNDPAIECTRGDLAENGDLDAACAGVDYIYHLAGIVSRDPWHAEAVYAVNVGGTRSVCQAAARQGVKRLLLVSSSGTVAVSRTPQAQNEDSGYKYEIVGEWAYYLSKIYAEKAAFDFYQRTQLPVVVVNPSLLLGPGGGAASSNSDIALFLAGQIKALPGGGLSFVDVRDAAAGLIAAMERGRPGERYLLGGPNWTFRELIHTLAPIAGRRAPRLQLPLGLARASAALMRELMPVFGAEFLLDDVSIKMSSLFWYCDTAKAQRELGWKARDPLETLRDTVQFLRQPS